MAGKELARRLASAVILLGMLSHGRARGGEPAAGDALVVRLSHPDRQAREVLRLFEGARWSDPAAALAAWKRRRPDAGLGKPAEALIALLNPEMAREWRVLDRAELRVHFDADTGEPGWLAIIPGDDGTVADAITAMRLSFPEARPLTIGERECRVARLDRSGTPLGCRVGEVVVVASSRGLLERGAALAASGKSARIGGLPGDRDSGTCFRLEPDRLRSRRDGSLRGRRAIEALRASGCRRLEGFASLEDGALLVDVTMTFADGRPGGERAVVDPAWLEGLPADGVMAAFCLAIPAGPGAWDRAFAAADRVERIDPARANLAPLRTRLNLMAIGAGIRLEADLIPHLRGVSACLFGDPDRPGRLTSVLAVLHLDGPDIARGLARDVTPRLGALSGGASRPVLEARDRDVRIAWGDRAVSSLRRGRPAADRSIASVCGVTMMHDPGPPARVGAFWPARIWRPAGLPEATVRALADDPPVIWRGWDEPGRSHDLLRWTGLRERVRGVLASIPAAPSVETGGREAD